MVYCSSWTGISWFYVIGSFFEEYASFYLKSHSDTTQTNTTISEMLPVSLYYPSYLPDGMQLSEFHFNGSVISYYFQDNSNNSLKIEVLGFGSVVNMDQEDLETKEVIDINRKQVYLHTKNDVNSFIWTYEEKIFTLITTLSKDISVRIIDGIMK